MEEAWQPTFYSVGNQDGQLSKCHVRVVSYNVLAQAYVQNCGDLPNSPLSCKRWQKRAEAIKARLLDLDADFLCLQELDGFDVFYKYAMDKEGYGSVYIQRGRGKQDGCGIFFRRSKAELLQHESIDFNALVPPSPSDYVGTVDSRMTIMRELRGIQTKLERDCVAIVAAFKILDVPEHILVLATTHIFWDPVMMDVKLAQVALLGDYTAHFVNKIANQSGVNPDVIITGDFNSLPGDVVYNYMVSGQDAERSCSNEEVDPMVACYDKLFQLSKFPLPVVSVYAYADQEPEFTNYNHNFKGTLDYVLFVPSQKLKPARLLALPKSHSVEVEGGLPNALHPSDHLPVGCDFALS